jgi:hypothetical protein
MLGATVITIAVLSGVVAALYAPLGFRIGGALWVSLVGVTVVGAGLSRWLLDLNLENKGAPPIFLPAPMNSVLGTLGMLLVTAGPVVAGALLMLAYREARAGRITLALLYVVGLLYVVDWAPWVIWSALG